MNEKLKVEIEEEIDRSSLDEMLSTIAEICDEKADHIRASYSDDDTADWWSEAGAAINDLADDLDPDRPPD